ncbi:hypothetical protein RJ640_006889 [Escallonia rubra]|uniref:Chalcone/stilbene synthase N-terminal domain-containing protein n=1 Tax=Escallonia rubra TaxID=112253 RepID=A0AA88RMF8_9ASTE|nr:hypothetical protein RJ640_006889 [Escallonia rubra]
MTKTTTEKEHLIDGQRHLKSPIETPPPADDSEPALESLPFVDDCGYSWCGDGVLGCLCCEGEVAIGLVVFGNGSGDDMPDADYQLTKLLGLRPSVKRLMMYQQGQIYYAIEVLKTKQKGERKLSLMKMTV